MPHQKAILTYFPQSAITEASKAGGYLASVMSKDGNILISEFGKTESDAWRNAYSRLYLILQPILGIREATQIMINGNPGEWNGIHQGTVEPGKATTAGRG